MWRMLENRDHHNVRTTDGRDFRKNYRVPATFFDEYCSLVSGASMEEPRA